MFTEDHDAFFETNGHAIAVTYRPTTGAPTTVNGIFNDEYFDEVEGMVPVESSQPMFYCKLSDVPGVVHGDHIEFNSSDYNVMNVQPDGTGQVVLILEQFIRDAEVYNLDFSKNYNSQYLALL